MRNKIHIFNIFFSVIGLLITILIFIVSFLFAEIYLFLLEISIIGVLGALLLFSLNRVQFHPERIIDEVALIVLVCFTIVPLLILLFNYFDSDKPNNKYIFETEYSNTMQDVEPFSSLPETAFYPFTSNQSSTNSH